MIELCFPHSNCAGGAARYAGMTQARHGNFDDTTEAGGTSMGLCSPGMLESSMTHAAPHHPVRRCLRTLQPLNQFVLRRDREGIVRFASLQSPLAARILARHGVNPQDLDSVYVVLNHDLTKEAQPDERLLPRSDAVIFALKRLGGIWKVLGLFVQLLPRFLRDWGYRVVARNRYRVLGRFETCMLPNARDQQIH